MNFSKFDMPAFYSSSMLPKVTVNCAMSVDGKIASRMRKQVRLSDETDMARVHRLRNDCDAILVGIGTVLADDPSLLVKEKYVDEISQPIRVIIDPNCKIPTDAQVLDGRARTIIASTEGCKCELPNAEILICGKEYIDLRILLERLGEMGVENVMVEGGGETIWGFVRAKLVNTFTVFISNRLIGGRDAPTPMDGEGFGSEEEFAMLALNKTTVTESGIILEFGVG